jgi:hypothetical protein
MGNAALSPPCRRLGLADSTAPDRPDDALARLVKTDRYPDDIIAALTLEPAGRSVRWSLVALDHGGDGVLYVRCARDDRGGKSLLRKYRQLQSYCDQRALRPRALIVALGSGLTDPRPDMARLLELASEDWCSWVCSLDVERFSRDYATFLRLEAHLATRGIKIHTPRLGLRWSASYAAALELIVRKGRG